MDQISLKKNLRLKWVCSEFIIWGQVTSLKYGGVPSQNTEFPLSIQLLFYILGRDLHFLNQPLPISC